MVKGLAKFNTACAMSAQGRTSLLTQALLAMEGGYSPMTPRL